MTTEELEQAIYAKTRRFVDSDVLLTIQELLSGAVAREREACATACVDYALSFSYDEETRHVIYDCADAIRSRAAALTPKEAP